MTERLAQFGIAPAYRPHLRHFLARAKAWGLSQADIEAHLEFAAGLPERMADDELLSRYHAFADSRKLPPEIAGLATEWREQVMTRGIEALDPPIVLVTEADRRRLGEIETEMRKPRGESAYWRDPDLRDEYLDLLERFEARDGAKAAPTGDSVARPSDVTRKALIEAAMREGRGGAYFRPASPLPDEYRAILEREHGDDASTPSPIADQPAVPATPFNEP